MAGVNQTVRGFTLLEMLVVITLMSIVAAVGLFSYEGVQDEASVDTTKIEMLELKKALLQFRADNGAFPCTVYNEFARPYELVVADMVALTFPAGLDDSAGDLLNRRAWCEDNALQMLRKFPFNERDNDPVTGTYIGDVATTHPLWSPELKRGWRGPYLTSNDALTDAWGNAYRLYDLELDFHPARKYCDMDSANTTFAECRGASEAGFDPAVHLVSANVARVVSAGPDGLFGETNADNYCQANLNSADAKARDDIVLCLLQ
ncbi:MAG: prepilin-type N-terminal cleavage/methylation domain-containing protein [Methylotenera sp.]|nr:prepilin-type N-terminal cleavage/methylation domain-containing protein [Methylotenera sp.]MDO9389882.1 prepilin-type N-terminal cleavage/methylation domain-containing protein [Methylotenera sp.]